MKFDAPRTSRTYSDRTADDTWKSWCAARLAPAGRDVVDVGCGGGIYTLGFASLGARSVIGVDGSRRYIAEALRAAAAHPNVSFRLGSASATTLPQHCADIVFERALIHHLTEAQQRENAGEALRVLRPGGRLIVQDRTFDDVASSNPDFWIRNTLFEVFPRLLDVERSRRPSWKGYARLLREEGFEDVQSLSYGEVRRRYASFDQLREEILARKGKSLLFELTDQELDIYCRALQSRSDAAPLIEKDAWTIWIAVP
jgi:ubiquinone/menaquinone biosynthesis C-methylase UbiE